MRRDRHPLCRQRRGGGRGRRPASASSRQIRRRHSAGSPRPSLGGCSRRFSRIRSHRPSSSATRSFAASKSSRSTAHDERRRCRRPWLQVQRALLALWSHRQDGFLSWWSRYGQRDVRAAVSPGIASASRTSVSRSLTAALISAVTTYWSYGRRAAGRIHRCAPCLMSARISSTRHAVIRGPSLTGWGYRPDLTPAHHVDLPTGIGPAGAMIEERRTRPVSGRPSRPVN